MITLDKREVTNNTGLYKALYGNGEVPFEVDMMNGGDCKIDGINGSWLIEVSSIVDFIGKIKSGRLWEQAEKCLADTENVIFCIVGRNDNLRAKGVSMNARTGAKFSLMRRGIHVVHYNNYSQLLKLIKIIADKMDSKSKTTGEYSKSKPKEMSSYDQAMMMLMSVKGIGEATARKILAEGSIYDFIQKVKDRDHKESDRYFDVVMKKNVYS